MQPSGRDEFGLARLDFLDDFGGDTEQLRQQALAKLPVSGEKPVPRERYEGSDGSGAVVVTINAQGIVVDVDVKRDWGQSLSADGFAAALMQAFGAATAASLEDVALAELWEDEQRRSAQRRREAEERWAAQRGEELPPPPGDEEPRPDVAPEDPRDWMAWIQDSLYKIGDELYRIERVERGMTDEHDRAVWGSRGYLKVIHRGKDIVSIEGDAGRIRTAEPYQLKSEALEVLRSAQHDSD
jgi:DNA-binding protein YbaB